MQRRHVFEIMAGKADTPEAANRLLKLLHMIMNHAIELKMLPDNPTLGVKPFTLDGDGYHTRTEDEISRFYEVHARGTVANLAMSLMIHTGAARSDAIKLGWGNVKDGRISYRRTKTQRTSNLVVDIPIHSDLAATLELLPRDGFTFLQIA